MLSANVFAADTVSPNRPLDVEAAERYDQGRLIIMSEKYDLILSEGEMLVYHDGSIVTSLRVPDMEYVGYNPFEGYLMMGPEGLYRVEVTYYNKNYYIVFDLLIEDIYKVIDVSYDRITEGIVYEGSKGIMVYNFGRIRELIPAEE